MSCFSSTIAAAPSRGTAFQAPIHGRLGEIEVADQVLGARWLGSQSYVDRIAHRCLGLELWRLHDADADVQGARRCFAAGVSGAPVTDWTLYDTHYTERYLERPSENAAGYEASSVLPYAKDLRGKLLVIHGMADDNVLFLHSTKLFRRLQDLGKPFEVMVYPGAKHGLLRQHDGRHAYAAMLPSSTRASSASRSAPISRIPLLKLGPRAPTQSCSRRSRAA